ncbi:MAG: type II secretion system protein, partial [bacterium]|nr:type II secretion system protein [bacterium]
MFPGSKNQGFTLLEVMVAITILAGMALAMFGASSMMLESKDVVEKRDEASHSASFAMNKIAEDLNAAFFIKSRDMLGTQFEGEVHFSGKEERLDFASFTHLRYIKDAKETDIAEISYYLAKDPEDPDLNILMRREATTLDKDMESGGKAYSL